MAAARAELERACDFLISPSVDRLDQCAGVLEGVLGELTDGTAWLTNSPRDAMVLREAQQLRSTVLRAGRLLQNVADYHTRWARILGAMSAGYTNRGDAAQVARPSRIWLRG